MHVSDFGQIKLIDCYTLYMQQINLTIQFKYNENDQSLCEAHSTH